MAKFSRIDTLRHTQEMLRELRRMSAADRDPFLTYLLDMAYSEASDRIRSFHAQGNSKANHEANDDEVPTRVSIRSNLRLDKAS